MDGQLRERRTYRDVYQLDPKRVADQVIREHGSPLKASIGPSLLVRVGDVELRDSDGVDLVGSLGNSALDGLFVVVGENRRHGGGGRRHLHVVVGVRRGYGKVGRSKSRQGIRHCESHTAKGETGQQNRR